MSDAALVRMANQIAANFSALPDDEAAAETADHISRFWEPRMRQALIGLLSAEAGFGLSPVARAAAARLT